VITINKFPICILSSARTSSTALAESLRNLYNLDYCFQEPNNWLRDQQAFFYNNFLNSPAYLGKKYVIKLHPYDKRKYPGDLFHYFAYSPEVFRIRLQRRNIVQQVASWYIARTTGKFHTYRSEKNINSFSVDLDLEKIKQSYKNILDINQALANIVDVDMELYTEDILDLPNCELIMNIKPENYSELLYEIGKIHQGAIRDRI
jgi:LPS sulfotransferase NodH